MVIMKVLGTVSTENEENRNTMYGVITAKDNTMYCRECGIVFEFSDDEVDRSKALPHIKCPNCEKELQMPSKYLKKN